MSTTVFVSNMAAEHDYSSATLFGALRPITSGNYPIYKTARLVEEISHALLESKESDYLLISGSSVVAALCTLVWITLHPKINILMWDRGNDRYVERSISKLEVKLQLEQMVDRKEGRIASL